MIGAGWRFEFAIDRDHEFDARVCLNKDNPHEDAMYECKKHVQADRGEGGDGLGKLGAERRTKVEGVERRTRVREVRWCVFCLWFASFSSSHSHANL